MMNILLLAATDAEIDAVGHFLHAHNFICNDNKFNILITGIGSMHTTYSLMSRLHTGKPDFMIQVGVGGSFSVNYPPGSLVIVAKEINGDLGVEEKGVFKDVFDMGIMSSDNTLYFDKSLVNHYCHRFKQYRLPLVTGITVNEITTNAGRIKQLKRKYKAEVESMEGAAFHLVAKFEKIPFIQLRAISNYVGERNKSKWKMKEAIDALNDKLKEIIVQHTWKTELE